MDLLEGVELDTTRDEIFLAASTHDLAKLKPFLRTPGAAQVQDPETGFTPLHSAIAACGQAKSPQSFEEFPSQAQESNGDKSKDPEDDEAVDLEAAKAVVKELFLSGAIWNDLDLNNETPGCLAWRLGQKELYELVVEAGVRAEVLMNLMGGYEELDSEDDVEDEQGEDQENGALNAETTETEKQETSETITEAAAPNAQVLETTSSLEESSEPSPKKAKRDVNSKDYLASTLEFTDSTLLDSDANGVMMDWETPIMEKTAELLLPSSDTETSAVDGETQAPLGPRILNIGFGMGIIDSLLAATKPTPSAHHIIEAHPAVLAKLSSDECAFGPKWQASTTSSNVIHAGKWQDIVPKLIEAGDTYDAIYFDTFGESYTQLRLFMMEYVIGLLSPAGRFSFFNGLGADRRVCYDVYCRVVELDLCDAGFDVEWHDVPVKELGGEGEGEWQGVRRRYWTLDTYRLPLVAFMS